MQDRFTYQLHLTWCPEYNPMILCKVVKLHVYNLYYNHIAMYYSHGPSLASAQQMVRIRMHRLHLAGLKNHFGVLLLAAQQENV